MTNFPPTAYPHAIIDPSRSIRLIEILPGEANDGVACRLSTRDLDSTANADVTGDADAADIIQRASDDDYHALSYCWGGFDHYETIQLDDVVRFPVSKNLWAALKRLRSHKSNIHRKYWMDQICINQHDVEERNQQVAKMGEVYQKASGVLVWLGDAPDSLDESLPHNRRCYKALRQAIDSNNPSWWTRSWVVQEWAVARHEPILCFGDWQIGWVQFDQMDMPVREALRSTAKMALKQSKFNDFHLSIKNFRALREADGKQDLMSLGWVCCQTDCLNPRDKVYSLLALLLDQQRELITPDYNKPVVDVFVETTYTALATSGTLEILSLVTIGGMSTGLERLRLPSWVVDFQYLGRHTQLEAASPYWRLMQSAAVRGVRNILAGPPIAWTPRYPTTNARLRFDRRKSTLTITALIFDTVRSTVAMRSCSQDPSYTFRDLVSPDTKLGPVSVGSWLYAYNATERKISERIASQLDGIDPFRLLSNRQPLPTPLQLPNPPGKTLRILESTKAVNFFWLNHVRLEMLPHLLRKWDETTNPQIPSVVGDGPFTANDLQFTAYVELFCGSYALFSTGHGFLGVGSGQLTDGDLIVLPYGSRYPVALRPMEQQKWKFLGLVSVWGIMKDQLAERTPDTEFEELEFELV